MIKQFFICLFLFVTVSGYAQNEVLDLENKSKREVKKLGKEAERSGDYYLALEYYKELYKIDSNNFKNLMHLSDLLRHTRDYKEAEMYYQIICDRNANKFPKAMFYLSILQKNNGKHDVALDNFERFRKLAKLVEERKFRKLYKTELAGCMMEVEALDEPASKEAKEVVIIPLGEEVNNPHIDFSPIPLSDDALVFGSLRNPGELFYEINGDDTTEYPKRKLYVAQKSKDKWSTRGEWEGPFNSDDIDIGNGSFSLDKKRFYFTRCSKNDQFKVICKIYYSVNEDGKWSEPELMNDLINLEGYTSSHPTFGREPKKNEVVMYFVSDRERGKGDWDIWYSVYDSRKGIFKKPKNAGSKINTIGREMTPYYDLKSKTLYFSSNGRPNIGGLDIFKAEGQSNKWKDSENLGKPFNSYADDLEFVFKPSAKGGFLVSNREGGMSMYNPTCCDDIYEFNYLTFVEMKASGYILDKTTGEKIGGEGMVNVYIVEGEEEFLVESKPFKSGKYELSLRPEMNYRVELRKNGYFSNSSELSTKGMTHSGAMKADVAVEEIPPEPIVIPKITYDFASPNLTQDAKNTLDTTLVKLLKENPDYTMEIRAHTDSKGSEKYNMNLSQKRAESVVRYLVAKDCDERRLVGNGFGETLPIAPNRNEDGSDNPEGRQKNRRTEFKIIGNFDPDLIQYE